MDSLTWIVFLLRPSHDSFSAVFPEEHSDGRELEVDKVLQSRTYLKTAYIFNGNQIKSRIHVCTSGKNLVEGEQTLAVRVVPSAET
jgi:hypothetical protein